MILSKKQVTKALIRLNGCAGWSAPLVFANPFDRFSRVEGPFNGGGEKDQNPQQNNNRNCHTNFYGNI